jgi:uncharacterized protein (TIGR03084 family)
MESQLAGVLADLAAAGDELDTMVAGLDVAAWRTPTPAEGWDVATSIAHLAWTDGVAVIAATDTVAWARIVEEARAGRPGYVDAQARAGAKDDSTELLARWREGRARLARLLDDRPAGEKIPWFGPPMSATSMATARLMETWAHGLDVADGLHIEVPRTDRIRHVVHLGVRTRGYSFANRGLEVPPDEVRIELVAPSGETWSFGPPDASQRVTGSAWDFALLVTRRRRRDDLDLHTVGDVADRWLDVAQAFAGDPGPGRKTLITGAGGKAVGDVSAR